MAKKGKVLKYEERKEKVARYHEKRRELRQLVKKPNISDDEREAARLALMKMPRMSFETRVNSRCRVTGRPRGYLRKFQMSRIAFRELATQGLIPGVTKASW